MRLCPLCGFDRCDDTASRCRQCGGELPSLDEDADFQHPNLDSAYFHYLRIPKIGTVELVPGRAFRFGREPRNEFVMPRAGADVVAEIFWTDRYDEATVRELGADPVKVEGTRLKGKRVLKGGEEICVGPLVMTYLRRLTPVEGALNPARVGGRRRGADPRRGVAVGRRRPGPRAEALDPHTRSLPRRPAQSVSQPVTAAPGRVAKVLEDHQVTGTLRVSSPRGRGWITLLSGKPQSATFGEARGLRALEAILSLPTARCHMVHGLPRRAGGKPLEVTVSQVLSRLARRGRPPAPKGGRRGPGPSRPRGGQGQGRGPRPPRR
ncbi:MAG: DUF4388 domain-containing protein [Planctomycetota bacterium]|nr:MAG: DUF4388 domain-containing protein [Planctomycetota bacterium]